MISLPALIAALSLAASAQGFSANPQKRPSVLKASALWGDQTATTTTAEAMYDTPSDCYIIYPEDEAEDQEPKFVCTNSPEEYAWFNGLDAQDMIPTKAGTSLNAAECLETESFRGVPEWECSLVMSKMELRP